MQRKKRLGLLLFIVMLGISVLTLSDRAYRAQVGKENGAALEQLTDDLQAELAGRVQQRLIAVETLQAFLLAAPELPDSEVFDSFARNLLQHHPSLRALQYVDTDRTIRYIYPLAGNEAALNLDLSTRPAAPFVEKAIEERRMVVQNPAVTIQGSLSSVARIPLYRDQQFLGIAQGLIDISSILEELDSNYFSSIEIQLLDAAGVTFWGADSMADASHAVTIPVGDNFWTMKTRWSTPPNSTSGLIFSLIWGVGGLLLLTLAILMNSIWTRTAWLQESVKEKTSALVVSNEQLQLEKARIQQYLDVAGVMLLVLDTNGKITLINRRGCEILGFRHPDEIIGKNWFDHFIPEEDIAEIRAVFKQLATGSAAPPKKFENAIVNRQGEPRFISWNNSVIKNESGQIVGTISSGEDITRQRQIEEELRHSEARYRSIVEEQVELVVRSKPDTTILFANEAYCRFFGVSLTEMVGSSFKRFIFDEDLVIFDQKISRLSPDNTVEVSEQREFRADGTVVWLHWVDRGIFDEDGQLVELQAVGRDITKRKTIELERERLVTELQSKNAEMERFTYTISHDLRNPLITIQGFLGLLEEDIELQDDKRITKDISRIRDAAVHMGQLLGDLLTLSRIGRQVNPPVEISLHELTQEALQLLEGSLGGKTIQVDISPDLPIIHADRPRILEAMMNLIDNSIRYMGDQKKPLIEIGTVADTSEHIIFIRDNGLGIDPRYHDKVFGLFERLDNDNEGTGVGLAIVKRTIEVHGGRIWVESAGIAQGSTFFIALPLES